MLQEGWPEKLLRLKMLKSFNTLDKEQVHTHMVLKISSERLFGLLLRLTQSKCRLENFL